MSQELLHDLAGLHVEQKEAKIAADGRLVVGQERETAHHIQIPRQLEYDRFARLELCLDDVRKGKVGYQCHSITAGSLTPEFGSGILGLEGQCVEVERAL